MFYVLKRTVTMRLRMMTFEHTKHMFWLRNKKDNFSVTHIYHEACILLQCCSLFKPILGSVGMDWFGLMLNVTVNNYGHVRMVSSPNHTFFLRKLD